MHGALLLFAYLHPESAESMHLALSRLEDVISFAVFMSSVKAQDHWTMAQELLARTRWSGIRADAWREGVKSRRLHGQWHRR